MGEKNGAGPMNDGSGQQWVVSNVSDNGYINAGEQSNQGGWQKGCIYSGQIK